MQKRKLAAGAAAALVVAGGGVAVAASHSGSPKEESQAVVADAAKQLGIEPDKLSAALKKALENRVDAAVAAGRLTKDEGDALKARIESSEAPLFPLGGPPRFREHHLPAVDAAAAYLGLTEAQLRSKLESGKTLAQIATEQGKTAEGLVKITLPLESGEPYKPVRSGRDPRPFLANSYPDQV